jgi:hypothetical protein
MAGAVVTLSRDFGPSRRQADRYIEEAQAAAPAPAVAEGLGDDYAEGSEQPCTGVAGLLCEQQAEAERDRATCQVSVLSGAPFGYRYLRKSEQSAAYYEINEMEAPVVRLVYERYIVDGLSIGAITRLLNEQRIPTRKQTGRWERSTVWAMLRNPAYKGAAGFGKTKTAPRQRITRPLRLARRYCRA